MAHNGCAYGCVLLDWRVLSLHHGAVICTLKPQSERLQPAFHMRLSLPYLADDRWQQFKCSIQSHCIWIHPLHRSLLGFFLSLSLFLFCYCISDTSTGSASLTTLSRRMIGWFGHGKFPPTDRWFIYYFTDQNTYQFNLDLWLRTVALMLNDIRPGIGVLSLQRCTGWITLGSLSSPLLYDRLKAECRDSVTETKDQHSKNAAQKQSATEQNFSS